LDTFDERSFFLVSSMVVQMIAQHNVTATNEQITSV